MRRSGIRTALAGAVVGLLMAVAAPSSAWAGYADEPLYGDLDGDGRADRATLVPGSGGTCAVRVELAAPGGGYLPPTTYQYALPPVPIPYCPDMGVVVDLGGDGTVELVLAWFAGRPPGLDHDLLVLRDFTPVDGFEAIFQPSYIGLADFNGDGRLDVYEWTDQGDGFATYLNTVDGRLVPGPIQWCSGRPQYSLADFDRDGATDVVIAYAEACADYATGVVVLLDDGRVVHLERDPYAEQIWQAAVVDADGDGTLDVRTVEYGSGEVRHHIGHGDGRFTPAPLADEDFATTRPGRKVDVRVLDNDAATVASRVTVTAQPRYGTVQVTSRRTIVYRPDAGFTGKDSFVYRLSEGDRSDVARVTIRVTG